MPAGPAWVDFWSGQRFEGGQNISLPAPLGHPPLLVREGSAIPLNIAGQSFDRRGDARAFAIFAPLEGRFEGSCYEDDGETQAWRTGAFGHWLIEVEATPDALKVDCRTAGEQAPEGRIALLLRPSETRAVRLTTGRILSETSYGDWRRIDVQL